MCTPKRQQGPHRPPAKHKVSLGNLSNSCRLYAMTTLGQAGYPCTYQRVTLCAHPNASEALTDLLPNTK